MNSHSMPRPAGAGTGCFGSQMELRAAEWSGIAFGAVFLLVCARGDLWLDEIWSFQWVNKATGPGDILSVFHHDNNHPLNTLWMMLAGNISTPVGIRMLAIASGVVSLVLMGRLARTISAASSWVAIWLGALSFPLALYFSEARGYAPAIACSLAASVLLVEHRGTPRWPIAAAFWMVCLLGMLSHATFLFVLMSLGAWNISAVTCSSRSRHEVLLASARWFLVPGLMAFAYYTGFLRFLNIGGGPEYSLALVLGHYYGYALGLPVDTRWSVVLIALGTVLYFVSIVFGMKGSWLGPKSLFLAFPFAALIGLFLTQPEILYFRYFLVFLPFFYIAIAAMLTRLLASSFGWSKEMAILLIAGFVLGQAPRLIALASTGRGGYQQALTLIAASPLANKVVTSDHDFRNGLLIEFFRSRNSVFETISYRSLETTHPGEVGWFICHSQDPHPGLPEESIETHAGKFRLAAVFPYAGVSGWHWMIYRADQPGPGFMRRL